MKFLFSQSRNPHYNLALEEYLLKHLSDDVVLCYVNDPSVVVGRFQVPYREVDAKVMFDNDICLVRRLSGGGTVFHDAGNLNYSYIFKNESITGDAYDFFNEKTQSLLSSLGFEHLSFERNNIFCSELKISGVAQYKRGNRMVHHGTLLVDADLDLLRKVFVSKMTYVSKGIPSVPSSVANITDFIPLSLQDVINAFEEMCISTFGEEIDVKEVYAMADTYAQDEWVFGHSPNYSFISKGISFDVKKGKIMGDSSLLGLWHSYEALYNLSITGKLPVSLEDIF